MATYNIKLKDGTQYDVKTKDVDSVQPQAQEVRKEPIQNKIVPSLMSAISEAPSRGLTDIALPGGPMLNVANEFKRKVFGLDQAAPGDIGAFAKDYFTDPRNYAYAGAGAMAGLPKPSLRALNRIAPTPAIESLEANVVSLLKKPTVAMEEAGTKRGLNILGKAKKSMQADIQKAGNQDLQGLTTAFKQTKSELDKSIYNEATLLSSQGKSKIKNLTKNMTETYRKGLDEAEEALASRGETIISSEYRNVVDSAIEEAISKNLPEGSPAFSKLRKISRALDAGERDTGVLDSKGNKIILANPDDPISLKDVKNLKNQVYDALSSGVKEGAKYATEEDEVANIFLRKHGEFMAKKSPELAELNAEFAPLAQARSWAMKNFRPFNENEITRAANVLSRIAKSKNPSQTDLNYLKQLESGSGRFKGTGSLRGGIEATGTKAKNIQTQFESAKKQLIDSTEYRIKQLESSINDDINLVKKGGFEANYAATQRQGEVEMLRIKIQRLERLRRLRNWAAGLAATYLVGKTLAGGASKLADYATNT